MWLAFDRMGASAVRPSIAAAVVIAKPICGKLFTFFDVCRPLQRKVNKE
jgi:hypothetical protein